MLPVMPSRRLICSAKIEGNETAQRDRRHDRQQQAAEQQAVMRAPGEQHRRGDGAGAGHQRYRQRKGGNVAHVLFDGLFRGFGPRGACGRRTPSRTRSGTAGGRRRCETPGSEIPSVRNSQSPISAEPIRMAPAIMLARNATLLTGAARQSFGDGEECRRKADRIDHDQQRHQSRNRKIERHGLPRR